MKTIDCGLLYSWCRNEWFFGDYLAFERRSKTNCGCWAWWSCDIRSNDVNCQ